MTALSVFARLHGTTSTVGGHRLVVPLLLLAAACGGGQAPADGPGGPGGPPGGFAVPVEILTLAEAPIASTTEFVGTVRSRRSTTIQPQAEGFLMRILVKSGDRIAPGTPLFEVDSQTQQASVAMLRSQRAAREADATFARQRAARAKTLFDVGATSQQELEQAQAQLAAAEAQLNTLDDQIRQAQTELAYYRVVSPTAGVVGDVPVRVGDRVTRSTMLTTVDDNAGLEVYIGVPVQQAPQLRAGLPVRILSDTGDVLASDRVNFVAGSVDDQTQTVLAKAPLSSTRGQFRSDQFVRAEITWSSTPGLRIPVISVMRVSGQFFVFVVEGAGDKLVARQRAVTLGATIGNEYVVTGGLAAGDRLITGGIQKIGDGAPVQAAPPAGTAPGGPGAGGRGGRP